MAIDLQLTTRPTDTAPVADQRPAGARLLAAAPELVGLVGCVVLLAQTRDLGSDAGGPGPALFPRLVLLLLAASLGAVLVQQLRGAASPVEPAPAAVRWPRFALGVALALGYVVGTYQLGWPIATALFLVAFVHLAGRRSPLVSVPVAVAVSLGLTYLFVDVVYVALPTGVGVFDVATDHLLDLLGVY